MGDGDLDDHGGVSEAGRAAGCDEGRQERGRVDGDGHKERDADFTPRIVEGGQAWRELEGPRAEPNEGEARCDQGGGAEEEAGQRDERWEDNAPGPARRSGLGRRLAGTPWGRRGLLDRPSRPPGSWGPRTQGPRGRPASPRHEMPARSSDTFIAYP